MVIWADGDDLPSLYGDPLEPWRGWAEDLRGQVVASGHHIAEEAPEQLATMIRSFLVA